MAKKKAEKPQDNRNTELFEALALIEKERGIPVDFMLSQIQKAIITACKSTYGGNEDAENLKQSFTCHSRCLIL